MSPQPLEVIPVTLEARALAEQAVRALAEQTAEIAATKAAELTAAKVVEKIFLHLGIDVTDPDQIMEARRDLNALREWRETVTLIKRKGVAAIVTTFITGVLGLFVLGVSTYLHR